MQVGDGAKGTSAGRAGGLPVPGGGLPGHLPGSCCELGSHTPKSSMRRSQNPPPRSQGWPQPTTYKITLCPQWMGDRDRHSSHKADSLQGMAWRNHHPFFGPDETQGSGASRERVSRLSRDQKGPKAAFEQYLQGPQTDRDLRSRVIFFPCHRGKK